MVRSNNVNDPLDYQINDDTVSVNNIEYSDNTNIVIPEEVEINGKKYTVTAINSRAFYQKPIKSIKIPATITFIGSDAFYDIEKLERVDFLGEKPNIENNSFSKNGSIFNRPIGYVNYELESWKGINIIDDLVIKNKLYYLKIIISIIIGIILIYIITMTDASLWFKLPLYILIILFSKIFLIDLLSNSFYSLLILFFIVLYYIIINLKINSFWKISLITCTPFILYFLVHIIFR